MRIPQQTSDAFVKRNGIFPNDLERRVNSELVHGKILADDQIYQKAHNIDRPKEIFIFIGEKIAELDIGTKPQIMDVGCASGSFLHYLKDRFPSAVCSGADVSEVLVARAQELMPDGIFFTAMLDQKDTLPEARYDITCCIGVMCYFDNIIQPLWNLISSVKAGGTVFISTMINSEPVDVVTRHRRSTPNGQGEWEIGWNIFSKQTYDTTLEAFKCDLRWKWHPIDMPFALEKQKDPMRSWTIRTEDKSFQLVNGASQLINMQVLEIQIEK